MSMWENNETLEAHNNRDITMLALDSEVCRSLRFTCILSGKRGLGNLELSFYISIYLSNLSSRMLIK